MTRVLTVDELEQRNRELATLIQIARRFPRTLDLTEALKQATQLAARVCGAHRCTVVLEDEDGEGIWAPVMSMLNDGCEDTQTWHQLGEKDHPLRLNEVVEAKQVIQEHRPLFIADARASSLPPISSGPWTSGACFSCRWLVENR